MRVLFIVIYESLKHQISLAPWKGIMLAIPGISLSLVDSLTSGFRMGAAFFSFVLTGLSIYAWIESRIKKRREK